MIATGLVALGIAATGFHLLALRFRDGWRKKWTAGWIAVGGLLFVASIFTTGIVHQSTWLVREDSILGAYEGLGTIAMRNMSNLRAMMIGLQSYRMDNGKFPVSLEELYPRYMDVDPSKDRRIWLHRSEGGTEAAWFYFPEASKLVGESEGAENEEPEADETIIVLADPLPIAGKRSVGFTSGHTRRISEEEFVSIMREQLERLGKVVGKSR